MSLESAIENIRSQVHKRKVRLQDICASHRPIGSGVKKITKAKFERALDQANIKNVTRSDLEVIYDYYGVGYDVKYQDFCDKVDECFGQKFLERDPTGDFTSTYAGMEFLPYDRTSLDVLEEAELEAVLQRIRDFAKTGGAIIKTFFADFDRNNDGSVTRAQFARQINVLFPNLNSGEVGLLIKKYDCHGGADVHYRALHEDVVPEGPPSANATMPESVVRKPVYRPSRTTSAEEVERKCMGLCLKDRVRPKEVFADFDKHRNGRILTSQFKGGLHQLFGKRLSGDEHDAITDKYKESRDSDFVRYKDFCAEMESVFVTDGLEKDPMAMSSSFKASAIQNAATMLGVGSLDSSGQAALEQGMETLRAKIKRERIDLKPTFKDFDPRREEHVTVGQFDRVVKRNGLYDFCDEKTWTLIRRRYQASAASGKGAASAGPVSALVNYAEFCSALDPPNVTDLDEGRAGGRGGRGRSPRSRQPVSAVGSGSGGSGGIRSVTQLVKAIGMHCRSNRIRLKEFFVDYDTLRSRTVTREQFGRCLDVAQVVLKGGGFGAGASGPEFDALCDAFPGKGRGPKGLAMVDYGTFCDEIEAAFTVRGLEQNPHIDVDRTVASFEDGLDDDDDNDAGGGDAALAMAKVREFALICAQRSVDPTPYLQDYDHNTNGCLAESVFMRVLATYVAGMDPQGDLQIMARHFRAAHSKGQATTRPDVDYRAFLVAVKAAQQQQGTGNNNTSSSIFASTTSKQFRKATRTTTGSSAAATMSGSSTVVRKPVVAPRDIDVTQLLKELREFGARNGVRIKDFFAENDKHRQGHITVAKFRTAMAQLKMPDLDEFEVTALINAYPADGMASDRVDYRSFVADVEPVSYLEGDPDARPVAVTQSYYGRRLSGRTEGMIDEIHTNIRRVCSSFKIHLKPFFKDFDRNNSRKLLKTNFLKVLDNSKISDRARLSSEQLEALCKAHEVVNDRGVATGFINYYNFVKVVDPTTEKS